MEFMNRSIFTPAVHASSEATPYGMRLSIRVLKLYFHQKSKLSVSFFIQ
jgi:hypothetical protein